LGRLFGRPLPDILSSEENTGGEFDFFIFDISMAEL